jgi:hypothetical protein
MGPAQGIGERLLALEVAVAELQAEVRALKGAGEPAPTRSRLPGRLRPEVGTSSGKRGVFPEEVEGLSNDDNCDNS